MGEDPGLRFVLPADGAAAREVLGAWHHSHPGCGVLALVCMAWSSA